MNPDAYEVIAANAFPVERRRYFERMASAADLLRSWLALEREADRAQKRFEGEVWSRAVGRACAVDYAAGAFLWELLLYSPDTEVRVRAAALIVRTLHGARKAA